MKRGLKEGAIVFIISLMAISCSTKDDEIEKQLNSKNLSEVFEGTYNAGLSGNRKYVPSLLHDLANPSASTSLHFKGFTLYTEKMIALEKILRVKAPHPCKEILMSPDSVNIIFFERIWKAINDKNQKNH